MDVNDDNLRSIGTILAVVLFAIILVYLFNSLNGASSCPPEAVECDVGDCGCCIYDGNGQLIEYCDSGVCPSGYVLVDDQCCNVDSLDQCIDPQDACINPATCDENNPCCSGYDCSVDNVCEPCTEGMVCDPEDINSCCNGYACNSLGRCQSLTCDGQPCDNPGEPCEVCNSENDCITCNDNAICTSDNVCQAQGNCPEGYYSCSSCPSGCCDALTGGCFDCVGQPCDSAQVGQLCEVCEGDNCGTCLDSKCVNTGSGYYCVSANDDCPEGTHSCTDCSTGCCADDTGLCLSCEGQSCAEVGSVCVYCVDDNNCVTCENTLCAQTDDGLTCVSSGDCPPGTVPNENCEEGCGLPDGTCPSDCEGEECSTGDIVYDDDNWVCIVDGDESTTVDLDDLQSGDCEVVSGDSSTPIACTNGEEWQYFTVGEFNCFAQSGGNLPNWVFGLGPAEVCLDCQPQCDSDSSIYDLNGDGALDSSDVQLFLQICGGFNVQPNPETGYRECTNPYDLRIDFDHNDVNDERDFNCLNDIAEQSCCHLVELDYECVANDSFSGSSGYKECNFDVPAGYNYEFDRFMYYYAPCKVKVGGLSEVPKECSNYNCDLEYYSQLALARFSEVRDLFYGGCMQIQGEGTFLVQPGDEVSSVSVDYAGCNYDYSYTLDSGMTYPISRAQGDGLTKYYNDNCEATFDVLETSGSVTRNKYLYAVCYPIALQYFSSQSSDFRTAQAIAESTCNSIAREVGDQLCESDQFNCQSLDNCESADAQCSSLSQNAYSNCKSGASKAGLCSFTIDGYTCQPPVESVCFAYKNSVLNDCKQFIADGTTREEAFGNLVPKIFIRKFIELYQQETGDSISEDAPSDFGTVQCS